MSSCIDGEQRKQAKVTGGVAHLEDYAPEPAKHVKWKIQDAAVGYI